MTGKVGTAKEVRNVRKITSRFRPERPVLSAQAEGLGKPAKQDGEPERLVRMALSGPITPCQRFPGLRPGLTERAFQARPMRKNRNREVVFRTGAAANSTAF